MLLMASFSKAQFYTKTPAPSLKQSARRMSRATSFSEGEVLFHEALAQLGDDLAGDLACARDLVGLEGDRADDGVAAAAVALADRGDVVAARARAEGVRADGDFRAEGPARDRDRVGRLRADVVRDELVEALDAFVNQVEGDDAAVVRSLASNHLDGFEVARAQRREPPLRRLVRRHFVERAAGEFADRVLDELVVRVLDDLHELERGFFQLDGLGGVLVESSVNRVRPRDERRERLVLEPEALACDARDELGAGLARGVPEFFARSVGAEVRLVLRREEGRLMMVEPPRQLVRRAVLEINDGVLVAVEHRLVEERARRVQQRRVRDFGFAVDARAVEAREGCGGGHAVEAVAVIEQA